MRAVPDPDDPYCAKGYHNWQKVKPGRGRRWTGLAECSLCGRQAQFEDGKWRLVDVEKAGRPR